LAVPAGYEAFHSLRRKGLTLICLCLASAVAMGTTVYVDSFSIHEWESYMDIGPVAMSLEGEGIQQKVDDIKDIEGIQKAATITLGEGSFGSAGMIYGSNLKISYIDDTYLNEFPAVYSIQSGRYPNSADEIAIAAERVTDLNASVGKTINYSYYRTDVEEPHWINMTVVGLFENHPSQLPGRYGSYFAIAIVMPEVLDPKGYDNHYIRESVHVEINRDPITPFDVSSSIAFVRRIEKAVRGLDPQYERQGYSQYRVNDIIGRAIIDYSDWRTSARMTQLMRSAGSILLVILLMLLAIRYNVNEREYETSMLQARGASKQDTDRIIIREILILSASGTILGLGLGVLLSRVALSAVGYFQFVPDLFFSEPFLITLESLVLTAVVGIVLPMLTLGGYFVIYAIK